jgi:hypothetical protein
MKNKQGEMIATHIVETGPATSMANNIGIQQGDPEKDEGVANGTFTPNTKPPVASLTRNS